MTPERSLRLAPSGLRAEIRAERATGGHTLFIDGHAQSHVYEGEPERLLYDYVRRIATVADLLAEPGLPLRVLHLGAGALTLARYLAATRPLSQQVVLESETNLVEFVLQALPLHERAWVSVHLDDARSGLAWAAPFGPFDLVVADVYSGETTPAHLTTHEFFAEIFALLAPQGVLAVNVADDDGLALARSRAATLRTLTAHVAVTGPADLVRRLAEGNAVIVASPGDRMLGWLPRLEAAGPHPGGVVRPEAVNTFIGGARAAWDADA